jgi:phage-related protein
MSRMQAVYYRAVDGSEPVPEFIDQLSEAQQAALADDIAMLNRLGPRDGPLPFPRSSQIEGELRELRCHYGRDLYRILYRRSGNLFILLHAFRKRSRTVSDADKRVAQDRWLDFKLRMDALPRRPPRPAGHDAP